MLRVVNRSKISLRYDDIAPDIKKIVKDYMPRAGKMIRNAAWSKIGTRQRGWTPLAESTLRKKQKSLKRMGKRAPWQRHSAPSEEKPLIDSGRMGNSIRHDERGWNKTSVSAMWPAEIHEQDEEMDIIKQSTHTPPKRPFLGPSMEESIEPIIRELQDEVGSKL